MPTLESGWHKWICFDHSHPHIFKNGKCLNCGMYGCYTADGQIIDLAMESEHKR